MTPRVERRSRASLCTPSTLPNREIDSRSFTDGEPRLTVSGQLEPGAVAGEYVVTALIARGGCGSVYHATHRTTGRSAAVKVLHGALAVLPKMVERFAREIEVVNLLRHPGIVEIYEVGALPDHRPFFVMEYVEGRTLGALLEQDGRLSPAEALDLLEPVAAALSAAHEAGVVHRDVKASNIIVTEDDPPVVKLLDFGIAKLIGPRAGPIGLTSEGRQVGTLTIMAPEQLLGVPVDARVDIYALGVLLYRLLTGRLPFDGKSPLILAQQHLEEPAPRPSQRTPLAPALDAIVLRCLEKRPERRYDTVKDFLVALRRAAGGPTRRRESAPEAPALAVGVYVELLLRGETDELDDTLSDDIGAVLDLAEEGLRAAGFLLAAATGSNVLGVRVLPVHVTDTAPARRLGLQAALALHDRLRARPAADPRVHANVCVHLGDVVMRASSRPEILGGALVRTEQWAPRERVDALCATPTMIEGLPEVESGEGPGGLVTVTRCAAPPSGPRRGVA